MRNTLVLFSLASVTLFACATGATLDGDGFGGAGSGGMQGVTNGSTSSKTSAVNSTVANSSANSTVANSSANSTVAGSTVASTSVASTSVASTSVASSSSMSSTGSGPVTCNPESPAAGCGASQHCVPTSTNMPFCDVAGAGVQWDNCLGRDECGPTFECIDDGITCCAKWCTSDSDCNTAFGEFCAGFTPSLLANGTIYGVCYDSLGCL